MPERAGLVKGRIPVAENPLNQDGDNTPHQGGATDDRFFGGPASRAAGPVPPAAGMQPHQGAVILTLGILGLVLCLPLGIAAWVMGTNDLREMNAGRMDPSGRDMTNVGRVLGIIACCLAAIGIVLGLVWVALFMTVLPHAHVMH